MNRVPFVFKIIAAVLIFYASTSYAESAGDSVVELTAVNFREEVLNTKGVVFIKCYLPYCRACREFKYAWNKIGESLKGVAKVARIDCDADGTSDWCYHIKCSAFPDFIVFNDGKWQAKHRGEYSGYGLVDFIKNKEYETENQSPANSDSDSDSDESAP